MFFGCKCPWSLIDQFSSIIFCKTMLYSKKVKFWFITLLYFIRQNFANFYGDFYQMKKSHIDKMQTLLCGIKFCLRSSLYFPWSYTKRKFVGFRPTTILPAFSQIKIPLVFLSTQNEVGLLMIDHFLRYLSRIGLFSRKSLIHKSFALSESPAT